MTGERNGSSAQGEGVLYFRHTTALLPREELHGFSRAWTEHILKLYGQIEGQDAAAFSDLELAEAKRMGFVLNALDDATLVQPSPTSQLDTLLPAVVEPDVAEYVEDYITRYDMGEITQDTWYEKAVQDARAGQWGLLHGYFNRFLRNNLRWHLHDRLRFALSDDQAWNANTVEDIMQDVWEKMIRGFPTIQIERAGAFRAWFFNTARNRAIDIIRRRHSPEEGLQDTLTREYGRPDVSLDNHEISIEVRRALIRLASHAQRDVLTLDTYGDYTLAEIAGLLGMSEGGVKILAYRGRRALADILTYKLSMGSN